MTRLLVVIALLASSAPLVLPSQSPPPSPFVTPGPLLVPVDADSGDEIGAGVHISGELAILGGIGAGPGFTGAATIYRLVDSMWIEEQHLVPSSVDSSLLFGDAVAIDGNFAFVGAPLFGDGNAGAVFVYAFDGTTWNETQVLTSPLTTTTFGRRLSLSGDRLLVGHGGVVTSGPGTGGADVFRFESPNWVHEATLIPAAAAVGDLYGHAVALSGTVALLGGLGVDAGSFNTSGAATFFEFDGANWVEGQTVSPLLPSSGAFGTSVSIDGDRAVVGADLAESEEGLVIGAVTVFERVGGTWFEQAVLPAPNDAFAGRFGRSVAICGDEFFVGDPLKGPGGSTYHYRLVDGDWTLLGSVIPSGTTVGDEAGEAISFDGESLLVGAPNDSGGTGSPSGSASVFTVLPAPVFRRGDANQDGVVDIADPVRILNSLFPDLTSAGIPCEVAADANDDETVNLADVVRLLSWLFVSAEPPLPAPECGPDPTSGTLTCLEFTFCP